MADAAGRGARRRLRRLRHPVAVCQQRHRPPGASAGAHPSRAGRRDPDARSGSAAGDCDRVLVPQRGQGRDRRGHRWWVGSVADVRSATRASTGCGGCAALLKSVVDFELEARGVSIDRSLCDAFPVHASGALPPVPGRAISTSRELSPVTATEGAARSASRRWHRSWRRCGTSTCSRRRTCGCRTPTTRSSRTCRRMAPILSCRVLPPARSRRKS